MHFAIRPVDPATAERLPQNEPIRSLPQSIRLPLIRLSAASANPLASVISGENRYQFGLIDHSGPCRRSIPIF